MPRIVTVRNKDKNIYDVFYNMPDLNMFEYCINVYFPGLLNKCCLKFKQNQVTRRYKQTIYCNRASLKLLNMNSYDYKKRIFNKRQ